MSKKTSLKRLKKDKSMRAKTRLEIGRFLVEFKRCTTMDPLGEWIEWMENGITGYFQTRNRVLIDQFEEVWRWLNDPTKTIVFYAPDEGKWNNYGDMQGMEQNAAAELREDFRLKANMLMDTLMEAILGLEEEDERRQETGKTYERRLSPDDLE